MKLIFFIFMYVSLLSALTACSSRPKQSFTNLDLEKRGDEYLTLGDKFRLQGRHPDALQYYKSAQALYFKKWNPEKFILAGLKECAVHIMTLNIPEAEKRMDYFSGIEKFEDIKSLKADMMLTQAMLSYAKDDEVTANKILDEWSLKDSVPLEKRQYMKFYRMWKSSSLPTSYDLNEILSEVHSITQKYHDGSLENPEVAYFSTLAAAEILEKQKKFEEAWQVLQSAIAIHRQSEIVLHWPRIFLLASRLHGALNNVELGQYYRHLYQEQLKTPIP